MRFDDPFDKNSPRSFRDATAKIFGDIQVIEIGYNRVSPGLKQMFKRDVYILHYITSGKGKFLNEEFDKNSGYLVVPDQLEIHVADEGDPYEAYWIIFRGEGAEDVLRKCGIPSRNGVFPFDKNAECAKILKRALFDIHPKNDFEEACIMQAAFYEIIALHMHDREDTTPASSIVAQNARDFIKENYHRQIKIGELAKNYNITRNYLYTLFEKEYGISPQEFMLKLRIEKAKQLLGDREKNLSVSEIAFTVGFNDPLYFSRVFKKLTNASPSEFRKNNIMY